ncbi:MAG TPA: SRPBCC domain-containing protein [Terracidiphilus sp.]|nr:SRPBCC domain-containing protein [Terracidiphilus sp.]
MSQVASPVAAASGAATDSLKVNVSRVVRASRQRVFEAWTKPEQMQQWMGPVGWIVPELEADVRPGGKYRIVYRGTPQPAPGETPQERTGACYGTYLEIVPPELIRYTWLADWAPGDETEVTIRLTEVEGGTLVELSQGTFLKAQTAANHSTGWTGSLGKLAQYLEG